MRQRSKPTGIVWTGYLAIQIILMLGMVPPLLGAQHEASRPTSHTLRNVEGWNVHVDDRLLQGPDAELAQRALHLLADCLYEITLEMQADRLHRLQQVPI